MKNKLLAIGFAAVIAAGVWLPGLSYAQTATAANLGITPGMSDQQIITILVQVVQTLMTQIQAITAKQAQVGAGAVTSTVVAPNNSPASPSTQPLLSAPVLYYLSNYIAPGQGAVQINISYQCGNTYGLYRSTDGVNWTLLSNTQFNSNPAGSCNPGLVDSNLPPSVSTLYYKYALLDSNNQPVQWSSVGNVSISGSIITPTPTSSVVCAGPTQDITAGALGNPNGTGPFEQLGLTTSTHPEILQYRIEWFDGSWSPWYVPGVNDLDWKNNLDGTARRIWSYFDDHTHEYILCSNTVGFNSTNPTITVPSGGENWVIGTPHTIQWSSPIPDQQLGCWDNLSLVSITTSTATPTLDGFLSGMPPLDRNQTSYAWDTQTLYNLSCGTNATQSIVQPGQYEIQLNNSNGVVATSKPFSIIASTTQATITVSGINAGQTIMAGQPLNFSYTVSPAGLYAVEYVLIPEGNTPKKSAGNGSYYDSAWGGYSIGGNGPNYPIGNFTPTGGILIPSDIPGGSYHLMLSLLPAKGSGNESPQDEISRAVSNSFSIIASTTQATITIGKPTMDGFPICAGSAQQYCIASGYADGSDGAPYSGGACQQYVNGKWRVVSGTEVGAICQQKTPQQTPTSTLSASVLQAIQNSLDGIAAQIQQLFGRAQ
jgi:hypothetical protein